MNDPNMIYPDDEVFGVTIQRLLHEIPLDQRLVAIRTVEILGQALVDAEDQPDPRNKGFVAGLRAFLPRHTKPPWGTPSSITRGTRSGASGTARRRHDR